MSKADFSFAAPSKSIRSMGASLLKVETQLHSTAKNPYVEVFFNIDAPIFPIAGGAGITDSPGRFFKSVFSADYESNPLLRGMTIRGVGSEDEANYFAGYHFTFQYMDGSAPDSRMVEAANTLLDAFGENIDMVRDGLRVVYEKELAEAKKGIMSWYKTKFFRPHDADYVYGAEKDGSLNSMDNTGGAHKFFGTPHKVVKRSYFEPVPGRPGRDAYGQRTERHSTTDHQRLRG